MKASVTAVMVAIAVAGFSGYGCEGTSKKEARPETEQAGAMHEGHDHAGHDHAGHDHGTMHAPKESASADMGPQTTCPVMGGAINKDLYVDHEGKRIYVCCEACLDDVKANPEKYIKELAEKGQRVEEIEG